MNVDALGGGSLFKGQGNFDLYNQESSKSPKVPRTQQQHTGGGIRDVISQTAGQIQTPGPAAPPQVAQPSPAPPPQACHSFWDPTNKRSLFSGLVRQPGEIAGNGVAPSAAETHRLHSISDRCNLIELPIMMFAELNVCPLQAPITLTQSRPPFPICSVASKHRHDQRLLRSFIPPFFLVFLSWISICAIQ